MIAIILTNSEFPNDEWCLVSLSMGNSEDSSQIKQMKADGWKVVTGDQDANGFPPKERILFHRNLTIPDKSLMGKY